MLTSIRLRNFKAFKDTGDVKIAPLTVLTGPNSSGKSAVIRALMALRQTVESRDQSAAFVPTGSYVDLGPFEDFVFMHELKSRVYFDVKCSIPAGPAPMLSAPITMVQNESDFAVSIEIAYLPSTDRIYLVESTIDSSWEGVQIRKATKGGKAIGRTYTTHVSGSGDLSVDLDDGRSAKFSSTPPFQVPSLRSMRSERAQNRFIGTQFSKEVEDRVVREFSTLVYIGPLRERPQRMYISTGEAPREVGSAGEFGPAVLWSASEVRQLDLEDRLSRWCNRMGLALEIELVTIYGSYFEVHAVDLHTKQHIKLPDVGRWTGRLDHYQVMYLLQEAGVAAGPVMDQRDAYNDPHLDQRGMFEEVTQQDTGTHRYPRPPYVMSETPIGIRRGPVRLGEDNEYVYKTLLRYTDQEYAELEAQGHIGMDFPPEVP